MAPPAMNASQGNTDPSPAEHLRQRNTTNAKPTETVTEDKEDLKKTEAPSQVYSHEFSLPSQGSLPVALLLTAAAFFTRLYKIGWANFVVWCVCLVLLRYNTTNKTHRDEAHFGKFASHYIKRTFYHDVHPPLGKMLNGIAGMVAGYNGQFKFESGGVYPPELNYTFMRGFNAVFGALMVPLAYYTGVHLKLSAPAAIFLALLVLCGMPFVFTYIDSAN